MYLLIHRWFETSFHGDNEVRSRILGYVHSKEEADAYIAKFSSNNFVIVSEKVMAVDMSICPF